MAAGEVEEGNGKEVKLRRSAAFADLKAKGVSSDYAPTSENHRSQSTGATRRSSRSGHLWRAPSRNPTSSLKKSQGLQLTNLAPRQQACAISVDSGECPAVDAVPSEPGDVNFSVPAKYDGSMRKDPLKFEPYGERWTRDVFSLPHNALREELRDLNVLRRAMIRIGSDSLTREHFSWFEQWWRQFSMFCVAYLDYGETVVLAHIVTSLTADEQAHIRNSLSSFKKDIVGSLQKMELLIDRLRGRSTADIPELNLIVTRLQDQLVAYFEQEERLLTPILEEKFPPSLGDRFHRRLVELLLESESGKESLVLLTYWLRNRRGPFHQWCTEYIPLSARVSFPRWRRKFETRHKGMVLRFERTIATLGSRSISGPAGIGPPSHPEDNKTSKH